MCFLRALALLIYMALALIAFFRFTFLGFAAAPLLSGEPLRQVRVEANIWVGVWLFSLLATIIMAWRVFRDAQEWGKGGGKRNRSSGDPRDQPVEHGGP